MGRKGVVWWVLLAVDIRQSIGGELFTARAFNEIMPGSVPQQVALRSRTCQTLVAAPRFFRLSCTTRRALKRATRHSISSRRSRRYRRAFTPAYGGWTRQPCPCPNAALHLAAVLRDTVPHGTSWLREMPRGIPARLDTMLRVTATRARVHQS